MVTHGISVQPTTCRKLPIRDSWPLDLILQSLEKCMHFMFSLYTQTHASTHSQYYTVLGHPRT